MGLNYVSIPKVYEWIRKFISHFTGRVIPYPCWVNPCYKPSSESSQKMEIMITGIPETYKKQNEMNKNTTNTTFLNNNLIATIVSNNKILYSKSGIKWTPLTNFEQHFINT